MAVTYSFEDALVKFDCVGVYPSAEVLVKFLAALEDPSCPPRFGLLFDVSRSESLRSRPVDEIRTVAEFLGPHAERVARCAVVAGADAQFGLGQLGAVYSEDVGVETRVFRTEDAAREWLDGRG
jgi:hypothetical protein